MFFSLHRGASPAATPAGGLTPAQERVRRRLQADVEPADDPGNVFMYCRQPEGTTRVLVGPDGTLVEHTAWSRPAA